MILAIANTDSTILKSPATIPTLTSNLQNVLDNAYSAMVELSKERFGGFVMPTFSSKLGPIKLTRRLGSIAFNSSDDARNLNIDGGSRLNDDRLDYTKCVD